VEKKNVVIAEWQKGRDDSIK